MYIPQPLCIKQNDMPNDRSALQKLGICLKVLRVAFCTSVGPKVFEDRSEGCRKDPEVL